jgi:hypothetical protein
LSIRNSRSCRSIRLQTVQAEILDRKAGDQNPVRHRPLQAVRVKGVEFRQIAHHPARERVTGAGRIDQVRGRKGGQHVRLELREKHRPVLAFLDDHEFRTELADLVPGQYKVLFAGQQLGFAVVQHQAIDACQYLHQSRVFLADPQIHGICHDQPGSDALIQHLQLHRWGTVGQKYERTATELVRQHWLEIAQNVQLHFERFPVVHIRKVLATPTEGRASGDHLQPAGVDLPGLEQMRVLRRPVLANRTTQSHRGEIAGRVGEINCRATQQTIPRLLRRVHAVQRNRTNNQQRHDQILPSKRTSFRKSLEAAQRVLLALADLEECIQTSTVQGFANDRVHPAQNQPTTR